MNKYVIYSALAGGYDEIRQPLVVDERFDYIIFTDSCKEEQIGVWQIRMLPFIEGTNKLKSGYVKCRIDKLLRDYEASLWIDGNIQIATQYVYDRFVELVEKKVEFASINHPSQQCAYDEICTIVHLRWVHDYEVVDWYSKMKHDSFPEHYGLYESNVLFRRHTKIMQDVGIQWWETLLKGCKRDQFSLMYLLWKVNPERSFFLPEDECPRLGSPNFLYYNHNPHKRVLKLGFHEMMRYRAIRTKYPDDIRKGYHEMFDWVSKFKKPRLALGQWELLQLIKWTPRIVKKSFENRIHHRLMAFHRKY